MSSVQVRNLLFTGWSRDSFILYSIWIDFLITFFTTLLAGQKHPRDPWVELEEAPPKTPRNASASALTSTSSGSTAANSTTSTAGDSAVGMSAGRAGPSCASTELPPLPSASTTPPGTPPLFAASPWSSEPSHLFRSNFQFCCRGAGTKSRPLLRKRPSSKKGNRSSPLTLGVLLQLSSKAMACQTKGSSGTDVHLKPIDFQAHVHQQPQSIQASEHMFLSLFLLPLLIQQKNNTLCREGGAVPFFGRRALP